MVMMWIRRVIRVAQRNAERAGVDDLDHFCARAHCKL
jgi:hypothetical protein